MVEAVDPSAQKLYHQPPPSCMKVIYNAIVKALSAIKTFFLWLAEIFCCRKPASKVKPKPHPKPPKPIPMDVLKPTTPVPNTDNTVKLNPKPISTHTSPPSTADTMLSPEPIKPPPTYPPLAKLKEQRLQTPHLDILKKIFENPSFPKNQHKLHAQKAYVHQLRAVIKGFSEGKIETTYNGTHSFPVEFSSPEQIDSVVKFIEKQLTTHGLEFEDEIAEDIAAAKARCPVQLLTQIVKLFPEGLDHIHEIFDYAKKEVQLVPDRKSLSSFDESEAIQRRRGGEDDLDKLPRPSTKPSGKRCPSKPKDSCGQPLDPLLLKCMILVIHLDKNERAQKTAIFKYMAKEFQETACPYSDLMGDLFLQLRPDFFINIKNDQELQEAFFSMAKTLGCAPKFITEIEKKEKALQETLTAILKRFPAEIENIDAIFVEAEQKTQLDLSSLKNMILVVASLRHSTKDKIELLTKIADNLKTPCPFANQMRHLYLNTQFFDDLVKDFVFNAHIEGHVRLRAQLKESLKKIAEKLQISAYEFENKNETGEDPKKAIKACVKELMNLQNEPEKAVDYLVSTVGGSTTQAQVLTALPQPFQSQVQNLLLLSH